MGSNVWRYEKTGRSRAYIQSGSRLVWIEGKKSTGYRWYQWEPIKSNQTPYRGVVQARSLIEAAELALIELKDQVRAETEEFYRSKIGDIG